MTSPTPEHGKGHDKKGKMVAAQPPVVVPRAMLKRWRRAAWKLTEDCYFLRHEGWYEKDCLERGMAKSKRCDVCKLLGEMDALITDDCVSSRHRDLLGDAR